MRSFYYFMRGLFYLPFKILYPTKVLNYRNYPADERMITVSNHYRWVDIPIIVMNVPGYRHFIAKKEIGKNKFVRKIADAFGVIFIDRGKPDLHAMRASINALKAGEGIAIFPEGTRNRNSDESLQAVKGGVTMLALKGDAPIVPLIIWRRERIFRKNYIYVGEPFTLDEYKDRLLNSEIIASASEKVAEHMRKAQEEMEEWIREKKWIQERKERKALRKERRALAKKSKKEYSKCRKEYLKYAKGQKRTEIQ